MNLITYKIELEAQIQLYKEFVPFVKNNASLFKLMQEIHRLLIHIEEIKQLKFDELVKIYDFKIIQRSCQINYPKNNV